MKNDTLPTAKYTPAKSNTIDFAAEMSAASEGMFPKTAFTQEYEIDGNKLVGFFDKDGNQTAVIDKASFLRMRAQQFREKARNSALPIQYRL